MNHVEDLHSVSSSQGLSASYLLPTLYHTALTIFLDQTEMKTFQDKIKQLFCVPNDYRILWKIFHHRS